MMTVWPLRTSSRIRSRRVARDASTSASLLRVGAVEAYRDGCGFKAFRRGFPGPLRSCPQHLGAVLRGLQRRVVENVEELLACGHVDLWRTLEASFLDDFLPGLNVELLPLIGGLELSDHFSVIVPELRSGAGEMLREQCGYRLEDRSDRVWVLEQQAAL